MMNIAHCLKSNLKSFSYPGILLATLFFSASLSPSLLPRPYILQGVLSGFALACGYGIALMIILIWHYLELPTLVGRAKAAARGVISLICIGVAAVTIIYSSIWQNELRELMDLPPGQHTQHVKVVAIAVFTSLSILIVSRLLKVTFHLVANRLNHIIPRRVANVLGVSIVLVTALILTNDLIVQKLLYTLDDIYSLADASTDTGVEQPINPLATGSPASLIPWDTIGRTGQNFITLGPNRADIAVHFDDHALKPLRVYAGLRSADNVQERAQLALAELIRVGGFERAKLIIATPTGTGWHDPSALDPVEYLHRGDTAIVTMQYSYLPSWLTLLVDPTRSKVSAKRLFQVVYEYWTKLPHSRRPDLYVYGLSLGSLGAETSIDLSSMFRDPIQGGVFAGPPFPSAISTHITKGRNPGSSQWLPLIKDGSFVRFTNQDNALDITDANWGLMRFVYIQYASDPMVFFSTDLWRREPDWLKGERGHDVSPALRWYPVVTFLQILFDLPMADRIPRGRAHNYAARSYIDAWIEVTQPLVWSETKTTQLKALFKDQ